MFILDQIVSLAKYTMLQYQSFNINIILLPTLRYILYFACVPNCKGRYSMI